MDDIPVMFARQPILTADGKTFGYEVLYRGARVDAPVETVPTAQTARVLCEALGNLGLDRIVGSAKLFVNFDQELLESDHPLILPPGRAVVEILETVAPTPRVFETLDDLRKYGIGIAFDDFLFQPNALAFLDRVDYVKVDVIAAADQLESYAQQLRAYNVPLIAEKVETHAQFVACQAMGFNLFQGYFFSRPELMRARILDPAQIGVVALIARLQNPDIEAAELADAIGKDLALAYSILRLANSAAFSRRRRIGSIADAVVLLGHDVIRQWAALLLLRRLGDHKSPELHLLALVRGRMCQALGAPHCGRDSNELFTVGLLSVLDALLDRSMESLVNELALAPTLREALCGYGLSKLGQVLRRAIAYERGDWQTLGSLTLAEQRNAMTVYCEATQFARSALGA
ncbi:MAG: EAL and HDOD domain-containing protein [Steroidobacteraceae bacterium]|jgi:c-di-GMP phosphodiesterase